MIRSAPHTSMVLQASINVLCTAVNRRIQILWKPWTLDYKLLYKFYMKIHLLLLNRYVVCRPLEYCDHADARLFSLRFVTKKPWI